MERDLSSRPVARSSAAASRSGRALRLLFGLGGAAFLVIAFRETWDRTHESVLPEWPSLLTAFGLAVTGLIAADRGWRALLPGGESRALSRAFFAAQLGKYIPGGVWQAAGQIGMSVQAGIPAPQAGVALMVHALTQVAAGGALGAMVALTGTDLSGAARLATAGALSTVALLHKGWMVRLIRAVRPAAITLVPPQRAILASSAWSVATLVASGGAFALLARGTEASGPPAMLIAAYALAWVVGFLALPFPSGIGVREAVLIATIGPPAPVIAVSLIHRLIVMAAEAAMVMASRVRATPRRTP